MNKSAGFISDYTLPLFQSLLDELNKDYGFISTLKEKDQSIFK